ncbi:hypothetical protein FPOAC1_004258 [Fusarium poae]|uniref:hypothetical protein n=1 Tax=Fusarium poae TaxID=36050 RepID=UPI001CE839E7|nr:hypothetical protein FPOAC1_004258 [Fusarium poae]KAG8671021.1 hypothetical protein FPOAC1_004258 [Fusarium poae]
MKQWSSRTSSTEPDCEFCTNETVEDDLLGALDNCPVCSQPLTEGYLNTVSATTTPQSMRSPAGSPMNIDTPEPPNTNPWFAPSIDMKRGQSSKMSAVINNIKESCLNTNLKSVVFSSWRDTLDILAAMLTAEGILFRLDPYIKVLLISINTGAVGLTLTEANMVHIVEPQWNPTIEEQAIARVVRMGQTRPVSVYKYIMNESVEQSVLKLQERKTQIIKLSMQDKQDDESDTNLDRFKFAIDPNEWKSQ